LITLYTFGPYFGLPDGSPFVMKAMLLLKIAGLDYREDRGGYGKAPKGKLPYIDDDGEKIADSAFIRLHIEKKYGFDFDAGLTEEQKAIGYLIEKLCEDHIYWLAVIDRWLNDDNFKKGPSHFFDAAPAPLRPLIGFMVRRKIRASVMGQGLGRHSAEERRELGRRAVQSASVLLADKAFMLGDTPNGVDATLGAFVVGGLCPLFESSLREEAASLPNIVAYGRRIMERYFPDYAK
jgi:glutathione S-transferase